MQDYILYYRNDGFWLVGPFESGEAAVTFARDDEANPYDDPRWQHITLVDARVNSMPILLTPAEHSQTMADSTDSAYMPEGLCNG